MAQDNTHNSEESLNLLIKEHEKQIQEWWFDNTLNYEDSPKQMRKTLKIYYAFIQIFYHEHFRESNTEIEKQLKTLIAMVEHEESYGSCTGSDKKLMDLVLGSAYRRLGQFKAERYQPAEFEQEKAIYYLEQDTSFFELVDMDNNFAEEGFVVMLLFLLNKAKYFRDIAEKDTLRVDASYWRAILLFQEIMKQIEEKYKESSIEGILARIYLSAWLNIAQVYRFQQEYELTAEECLNLISFCISSLENEEEKEKINNVVTKLPQSQDIDPKNKFSVKKIIQNSKNMADYLFEDYILQALLQLGISYRDRVDFNGSWDGNICVRRAIAVFLVLGIVDLIKDNKNDTSVEKIEASLDDLLKQKENSTKIDETLVFNIRDMCINNRTSEEKIGIIKNQDAQNNLAVCLKKLKHFTASIEILKGNTLQGNKFAKYNLCKCYLDSGLIEEIAENDYWRKDNTENSYSFNTNAENPEEAIPVCVYPDEPEKSDHKWLFLYARYLFAQKKFEEAEKMFSHIRNGKAMRWDSLELKAAYLEAQCQIQRGKYLSAIHSLYNIQDSLLTLDNAKSKKRHEIRTEIDLGWCLIVEDRYKEALNVYTNLLTYLVWDEQTIAQNENAKKADLQKELENTLTHLRKSIASDPQPDNRSLPADTMKWHAVSTLKQKELLHNLYDCWTYLHTKDANSPDDHISNLITKICESIRDTDSDIYMQFLKSLRRMNLRKRKFAQNNTYDMCTEWEELSNTFSKILKSRPLDNITYSCWIISKVNYCLQLSKQDPEFELQKKLLLLGFVSSTTPLTMKSYIELARIILNQEEDYSFLNINTNTSHEKGMELERAFLELFCHVRLLENGTNQAFMKLMTNQNFHSIELVTRANLLANIVELYGDILEIKTQLRVTYADLETFTDKETNDNQEKDAKSIIYQYTKLSTLKSILPKMVNGPKGESVENEPRFRMSNAARMNDANEGTMFKKICDYMKPAGSPIFNEVIQNYIDNSSGYKSAEEISSYDSNVYIASFSMNKDNFGLWGNYADKEKGCIIGFDQSFFDLVDKNYYSLLDDEAEENALYRILYVDEQELHENENDQDIKISNKSERDKTKKMVMDTIRICIPNLLEKLIKIEETLKNNSLISSETAGVIRAFIIDRLNEIRFLFKSASYEYEEEMRMLRCSQNPKVSQTDLSDVPWLYINVEKKLENLTLILGSKVELQQVKELSAWAKSTGRVKHVIWSGLNRL